MKKLLIVCVLAGLGANTQSFAYEKGDLIARVGAVTVAPAGDGALKGALDVADDTQLGLSGTYMIADQVGVSVLAATPFKHEIELNGKVIGTTKHLPPTVTVQYHFNPASSFKPYVGAGVNYTQFFTERSSLGDLELAHSVGPAAEIGFDYDMGKGWALNAGAWYADIDSKAKLNGAKLDTVKIDPWVYMVGAAIKF